jgi:arylsulfatase A-like enzyme
MDRREFMKFVGAGAAGALASRHPVLGAPGTKEPRKPNIIFMLADDLGYGDVGCFGQKRIATPNIDALAAGGMRFTDAYAGSTVCAPSRCALMTGLHTGHGRVRGNDGTGLRAEDVTVAEVLKRAGYTTGLTGKWALGEAGTAGAPTKKGFDYSYGYINQSHAHNYYPTFLWRNEEKVALPNEVAKEGRNGTGHATKRVAYSHDLITGEALKFIERSKDGPFFLYLAWTIPHANNEAPAGAKMEVPDLGPYANEDWPESEKAKAAMISRMDGDVGRVVALLKKLDIDDNTVIFFSSDNGPHKEGADPAFHNSSGPLQGIKRSLHDGGIRVPAIARWPAKVKAGGVSDFAWAFWDFLPTAAEIAGTEAPRGLDGISIVPTLMGRKQEPHELLYWEFHEGTFTQAARMGKWKAVRRGVDGPVQVYDLSVDVAEAKDVAAEQADIARKMGEAMTNARTKPVPRTEVRR